MYAADLNPYFGQDFLGFLQLFCLRAWSFIFHSRLELVSDEIQLWTLVFLGASAAILGCFLLLKKQAMVANSISHTVLLGLVLSLLFQHLLGFNSKNIFDLNLFSLVLAGICTGILTVSLIHVFHTTLKVPLDASNGLVFNMLFSLGVLLISLFFRNAHVGLELITGNVDQIHRGDVSTAFILFAFTVLILISFFKQWKAFLFDVRFAKILGLRVNFLQVSFVFILSVNVVGAMKAVGVLMMLALMTAPAIIARLLTQRLKWMLLLAVCVAVGSSFVGVALSRHLLSVYNLALSTGGLIVTLLFLLTLLTMLFAPKKGVIVKWLNSENSWV